MKFKTQKDLWDFHKECERSAKPIREQVARRMAIDGCYYEGIQWLNAFFGTVSGNIASGVRRLFTDYGPESRKIRATDNEITRLTQKVASKTYPSTINVSAQPLDMENGIAAIHKLRTSEAACNAQLDYMGLRARAADANERRWIFGTWLLGVCIEQTSKGACIKAFDADPSCLILEPSCQSRDLWEHPYVGFEDIWTLDRIERVFGIKINPEDAMTGGQLSPVKLEMSALSSQRLFTRFMNTSRAKCAKVIQYHMRTEGSRFGEWYIVIDVAKNDPVWVNKGEGQQETPFGGCGMPFIMLHGFHRADTMYSWGAPAQNKDHQDKRNLMETQRQRILRNHASPKAIIDRRWMGMRVNDDDITRMLNNATDRPIIGQGSDRVTNASPPMFVQPPGVPNFLAESIAMYSPKMQENLHLAPGDFGGTPTHVPYQTTKMVLDNADQVMSIRMKEDREAIEKLIETIYGTQIKLALDGNPETLAMLTKQGFGPEEFAVLSQEDPYDPGVCFEIDEGTYRHESVSEKKQRLDEAARLQMITPDQYQRASASSLGMALSEEDTQMETATRRNAMDVLFGMPWQPRMMGKWNELQIEKFVIAQSDPRARQDPATLQRLQQAVLLQRQVQQQEAFLANPQLQADVAKSQAQGETGQGQEAPQPGQQTTVAELLDSLAGAGAGSPG